MVVVNKDLLLSVMGGVVEGAAYAAKWSRESDVSDSIGLVGERSCQQALKFMSRSLTEWVSGSKKPIAALDVAVSACGACGVCREGVGRV